MNVKALLLAGIALGALAGSFTGAHAASTGVMNCSPHDWLAFAEAVETQDNEALQAMLSDPELHTCAPIINTVAVLVCDMNPSACLPPPPPPPPPPSTLPPVIFLVDAPADVSPGPGPFPGQAPGQSLGIERDGSDDSPGGDGGGSGGGSGNGGGNGGGGGGGGGGGNAGRSGAPGRG